MSLRIKGSKLKKIKIDKVTIKSKLKYRTVFKKLNIILLDKKLKLNLKLNYGSC